MTTHIEPRSGDNWRNTAGDRETLGGLLMVTFAFGIVAGFIIGYAIGLGAR